MGPHASSASTSGSISRSGGRSRDSSAQRSGATSDSIAPPGLGYEAYQRPSRELKKTKASRTGTPISAQRAAATGGRRNTRSGTRRKRPSGLSKSRAQARQAQRKERRSRSTT